MPTETGFLSGHRIRRQYEQSSSQASTTALLVMCPELLRYIYSFFPHLKKKIEEFRKEDMRDLTQSIQFYNRFNSIIDCCSFRIKLLLFFSEQILASGERKFTYLTDHYESDFFFLEKLSNSRYEQLKNPHDFMQFLAFAYRLESIFSLNATLFLIIKDCPDKISKMYKI